MKRFKHNGADIPLDIDGISIQGEYVVFADRFTDEDIAAIREKISRGFRKSYEPKAEVLQNVIKTHEPTQAEKQKIQPHLKGSANIDDFGFYTFIAAESIQDRHDDVLTKSHLEWMGEKYAEGRTLADSHFSDYAVGFTYDAQVVPHEKVAGEYQLEVKAYVPPNTKTRSGAVAKEMLDAGIIRRASVSFSSPARFLESDHADNETGKPLWLFERPKEGGKSEVYELSIVSMGAQAGARIKGEKARIEKFTTFDETEEKTEKTDMEKINISLKSLGKEVEVPKEVVEVIKDIDSKYSEAAARLKAFEDKEAEQKTAKVNEFVNLKKTIFPDLDVEKETTKANRFTVEELTDEIAGLITLKKGNQLNPGEEGNEGNDEPKDKNSYSEILKNL